MGEVPLFVVGLFFFLLGYLCTSWYLDAAVGTLKEDDFFVVLVVVAHK